MPAPAPNAMKTATPIPVCGASDTIPTIIATRIATRTKPRLRRGAMARWYSPKLGIEYAAANSASLRCVNGAGCGCQPNHLCRARVARGCPRQEGE
jgi:hypothetical protein